MSYHTGRSDEGLLLPYSGRLVGHMADAARLKTALRESPPGVSYKTVQRYFNGERIEAETTARILDALVDSFVPASFTLPFDLGQGPPQVKTLIQSLVRFYTCQWDQCAATLNDHSYPVYDPQDLPVPFLRLLALDLGLRWGAWVALRDLLKPSTPWNGDWLSGNTFGRAMERLRADAGLTLEALASQTGVSYQTAQAWCAGESLPTNDHIEALGAVLGRPHGNRQATELTLRLAVGHQALHRELLTMCGQERINDMLRAMEQTARLVCEHLSQPPPHPPTEVEVIRAKQMLFELVVMGAQCPMGYETTRWLADITPFNKEVAADFLALSGQWVARAEHWMAFLGSIPQEISYTKEVLARETGIDDANLDTLIQTSIKQTQGMSRIGEQPNPNMQWYRLTLPPEGKALNRAQQADRALSVGRVEESIEHLRHAVKHQPMKAIYHFKLGADLGILGHQTGNSEMMLEGLNECYLAVTLDPEFGNARNEIGIILANLRRHEEAEVAFAQAEPYHGTHSHHWHSRGCNYLALERFTEAERAFREAIKTNRGEEHINAMARLSAVLMKQGRTREAKEIGKKVLRRLGGDPTLVWEHWLDVWQDDPKNRPPY